MDREIGKILFQFVNGSFTTLKAKPKDIDVVSFIDYRIYMKFEEQIIDLCNKWNEVEELDIAILPQSYPGHPLFIQAQLAYEFWTSLFSRTRQDENRKRLPKGLIKINYYG
ncbi:MAG: hypothetical protein AB8G22_06885 [Saprospiraceae bacterium]